MGLDSKENRQSRSTFTRRLYLNRNIKNIKNNVICEIINKMNKTIGKFVISFFLRKKKKIQLKIWTFRALNIIV